MNMKTDIFPGCYLIVSLLLFLSGCEAEEPTREDTPEMITKVVVTFQPDAGETVTVSATDPDGDGLQSMKADTVVSLLANKHYRLSISMLNEFSQPGDVGYDISEEVNEESDEHMIFFGWTNGLFSDPAGDGNIDERNDLVHYLDQDSHGLPLGLSTSWITGQNLSGSLRILLKHQPDLKSSASQSSEGETDLDVTFKVTVE